MSLKQRNLLTGDWDEVPGAPLTSSGKPKRSATRPSGYAAAPGTGPAGERCNTCKHDRAGRRWHKCVLVKQYWTHGRASDVLALSPACSLWEATR